LDLPAPTRVIEMPLNEQMRSLMRIEMLVERARHYLDSPHSNDTLVALLAVNELLEVINRGDIKRELIKEIERQAANLGRVADLPGIDRNRYQAVMERYRLHSGRLLGMSGQPGSHLKGNELFSVLRTRGALPGGLACADVPLLCHWLAQPLERRRQDMVRWLLPLDPVVETSLDLLELVRQSAPAMRIDIHGGFYQQALDPKLAYQMLRLHVPADADFYPEFSAGKQRFFTLRLWRVESIEVPVAPISEPVTLHLACCAL